MNIHLANTDFEFELASQENVLSLEETWEKFPICLQLQFLPLLYADNCEGIAVTGLPGDSFLETFNKAIWRKEQTIPNFVVLNDSNLSHHYKECLPWGASRKISKWAQKQGISYAMPEWQIVKEINSKAYSFSLASLPGSELIETRNQLERWLQLSHGKRVLKTCFGVSGRGHYLFADDFDINKLIKFCETEWIKGRPLIGEPWVDRILDFSTQWVIEKKGAVKLIGSTVFHSNQKGVYNSTITGSEDLIFKGFTNFLDKHKEFVEKALYQVAKMGFFGNVGVDAFTYKNEKGEAILHPIVEINGRKTMSLIALLFQKKYFPHQLIRFCYGKIGENTGFSLLPDKMHKRNGKEVRFDRELVFNVI